MVRPRFSSSVPVTTYRWDATLESQTGEYQSLCSPEGLIMILIYDLNKQFHTVPPPCHQVDIRVHPVVIWLETRAPHGEPGRLWTLGTEPGSLWYWLVLAVSLSRDRGPGVPPLLKNDQKSVSD